MTFQRDIDKYVLVLRNFDEIMTQKADRTSVEDVYNYCAEKYEIKGSQATHDKLT